VLAFAAAIMNPAPGLLTCTIRAGGLLSPPVLSRHNIRLFHHAVGRRSSACGARAHRTRLGRVDRTPLFVCAAA
jgi:hypothetical protein